MRENAGRISILHVFGINFSVVSQNSNKVNEKTHITEMRKVSRIRTRPRRLTIARVMTILFLTIMVKIQRFLSNE